LTIWPQKITPPWKLFFSVGNKKKLFHNFNTATDAMAGLNIEFSNKFLTGCLSHLLGPVSDKNYIPLEILFFLMKTKKKYFTTLNQLPMAGLKI
jgi:hypothetical protein